MLARAARACFNFCHKSLNRTFCVLEVELHLIFWRVGASDFSLEYKIGRFARAGNATAMHNALNGTVCRVFMGITNQVVACVNA